MNKNNKQAYVDILSFIEGKTTKNDFINAFKKGSVASFDYLNSITDVLAHDNDSLFKHYTEAGLTDKQIKTLYINHMDMVPKVLNALFDIAYTRTPHTDPERIKESAEKHRNTGLAAEHALQCISQIPLGDASKERMLLDEYFYPRTGVKGTGMTAPHIVLNMIKQDLDHCASENRMVQKKMSKTATK